MGKLGFYYLSVGVGIRLGWVGLGQENQTGSGPVNTGSSSSTGYWAIDRSSGRHKYMGQDKSQVICPQTAYQSHPSSSAVF